MVTVRSLSAKQFDGKKAAHTKIKIKNFFKTFSLVVLGFKF